MVDSVAGPPSWKDTAVTSIASAPKGRRHRAAATAATTAAARSAA